MEIERKWLVVKTAFIAATHGIIPVKIVQGYLNSVDDEYLIRYRSIDNKYFKLEIKSKGLLSREELSYDISKEQFDEGLKLCKTKVCKKRYIIKETQYNYEIDVYQDWDFITLEIEFETQKEAEEFTAPWWFGKDVTYDPAYKNVNLGK